MLSSCFYTGGRGKERVGEDGAGNPGSDKCSCDAGESKKIGGHERSAASGLFIMKHLLKLG